jgi:putative salt-induced outer membrane protein
MPAVLRSSAIAALFGIFGASAGHAQGAAQTAPVQSTFAKPFDNSFVNKGYSGEVSLSGTATTGNTDSSDVGGQVNLRQDGALWRNILAATYDWGQANDTTTKNHLQSTYELGRIVADHIYGFGRAAYEADEFSGYDSRALVGGGLGLDVLHSAPERWSLQAGPAYRIDIVKTTFDPTTGAVLSPKEHQTSVALNAGSRFFAQVNDAVSFEDDTDLTSSTDTTTVLNKASLTTKLMGQLSARFSLEVQHDTSPPLGVKDTDTTSRASLVWGFGKK